MQKADWRMMQVPEHKPFWSPCLHTFRPDGVPILAIGYDRYEMDDAIQKALSWGRYCEVWDEGQLVLAVGPHSPLTCTIRPRVRRGPLDP